jgi:hypothetical protein
MIEFAQYCVDGKSGYVQALFAKLCPWIAASFLYIICENALSLLCGEATGVSPILFTLPTGFSARRQVSLSGHSTTSKNLTSNTPAAVQAA